MKHEDLFRFPNRLRKRVRNASRACYVDVNNPDQRETACYAWHGTRPSHRLGMRPSLLAQGPGDLCLKRRTIKSLSLRFWLSSSRSLGRCLLLGQRSPMNLHTVRPYIPHTSLKPVLSLTKGANGTGAQIVKDFSFMLS